MHAFTLDRRADEVAIGAESPAVIDALVNLRVAAVGSADAHPAVRAHIEGHEHLALLATGHNDRIRTHVTDHEVAGIRNFRFMTQHYPDLAEDFFHFQIVNFVVRQHTHLHFTAGWIDEVRDLGSIRQYGACSC
ncbi:hypothetical protein D3C71_1691510 [compost metagenome]